MSNVTLSTVLTVLRTHGGGAAKRWERTADGLVCVPYDAGYHFSVEEVNCPDFAALAATLDELSNATDKFVIRGQPSPTCDRNHTRRLLHARDNTPAPFIDVPRSWACFDYDGTLPDGHPSIPDDPERALYLVVRMLPLSLRLRSWWWQFGNSAGMVPGKLSVHLWCLFDAPIATLDVKRLYKILGFDPSLANAVQAHYVAKPKFVRCTDPIRQSRTGVIRV